MTHPSDRHALPAGRSNDDPGGDPRTPRENDNAARDRAALDPQHTSTRSMSRFAGEALRCLYQHRLLSSGQLQRLLAPQVPRESSYLRGQLRLLLRAGLAGVVTAPTPAREYLWFATDAGADLVESSGELVTRGYRMDAIKADGSLQKHMLAVAETGLAFVTHARLLGHDCGPLDWVPEVAHRTRDGMHRRFDDDHLVADAVLHYVADAAGARTQYSVFIEVDRATMTVARLAGKLVQYARYLQYVPAGAAGRTGGSTGGREAWRYRYPRFPRLLIVLTGAGDEQLQRRAADLRAYAAALPQLLALHDEVVGVTTLDRLKDDGPFGPIVIPILGDGSSPSALLGSARHAA